MTIDTINKYQLEYENDPKLRWVLQEDPLLSKSLIDEFLINSNEYSSKCNSAKSKVMCFNKRRTCGILVIKYCFYKTILLSYLNLIVMHNCH